MIVEKINQISNHIQSLDRKKFNQYLIIAILSVFILGLGMTYYIYSKSTSLVNKIEEINAQTKKISQIFADNEALQKEETTVQELLKKDPNFNMRSFFENFHTKHQIKPEPNWKPVEGDIIEGTEKGVTYQEVVLRATFKNETMKKLVSVLQDIYKNPIVYVKELNIESSGNKINFELTLATKQYKKEVVEE